jgi:K+-transporting ATPase ATPase C chain
MKSHILISIRITTLLLVITCGLYPLAVWAIGQIAFKDKANGSLIMRGGKVIGSELIGQEFSSERFFHGRPAGVSNLGPTSRALAERIAAGVRAFGGRDVPADAVTASASGADPHISPANAMAQAPRVARANHLPLERVQAMIRAQTEGRFLGIYGEPRVNVLLLNLDLLRRRLD